jgi:hypothetical protein
MNERPRSEKELGSVPLSPSSFPPQSPCLTPLSRTTVPPVNHTLPDHPSALRPCLGILPEPRCVPSDAEISPPSVYELNPSGLGSERGVTLPHTLANAQNRSCHRKLSACWLGKKRGCDVALNWECEGRCHKSGRRRCARIAAGTVNSWSAVMILREPLGG